MQTVYLICGVPGSGKTWVCKQLTDKFHYVEHDKHDGDLVSMTELYARGSCPVLLDCPFNERELRRKLEMRGIKVVPYFVVEHPDTVKERYEAREGRPIPKQHLTRARSIMEKVEEWQAPYGDSESVLKMLKELHGPQATKSAI